MGGKKRAKGKRKPQKKAAGAGSGRIGPDPSSFGGAASDEDEEPEPEPEQPEGSSNQLRTAQSDAAAWVRIIVRRGRVETQEWVPATVRTFTIIWLQRSTQRILIDGGEHSPQQRFLNW